MNGKSLFYAKAYGKRLTWLEEVRVHFWLRLTKSGRAHWIPNLMMQSREKK